MFGRRRHVAAVVPSPAPALTEAQVLAVLRGTLSELIGASGSWTLVPRASDDTETIFHELKANEIASTLAAALRPAAASSRSEPAVEPAALAWDSAPISIWAEPRRATVTAPVEIPLYRAPAEARLVA